MYVRGTIAMIVVESLANIPEFELSQASIVFRFSLDLKNEHKSDEFVTLVITANSPEDGGDEGFWKE